MDLCIKRLTLTLGIIIILIICCSLHVVSVSSQELVRIKEAEESFEQAFMAVNEASTVGSEAEQLKDLLEQLNDVIHLIDHAKQLDALGNSSKANQIVDQVVDLCGQIKSQAHSFHDEALQKSTLNKIFLLISVPMAALIVTIFFHYGYSWWRNREAKQILKMKIKKAMRKDG